jgi:CIC family chloride channel protein
MGMVQVENPRARLFSPKWEPWIVSGLAMVTGIIGGLGAVLFRWMIKVVHTLLITDTLSAGHLSLVVLGPAIGLVLVSLITHYIAPEVKGHGVPQILEAMALHGGEIRPRVGVFGIIAAAVTIGSGGSAGREGPIALIGAAFGSAMAQFLKLTEKYTTLLLAAGSAAGIAATFKAPIAGGFFGLEIILGSYQIGAVVPVFLAAVTGTTVSDAIMGSQAVLQTPPYHVINHFAVLFMIVLGLLISVVAVLYTKGLTFSEDFFNHLTIPFWMKAALGGLAIGIIGLLVPQVLGVGYPTMHLALTNKIVWTMLIVLFVAKYVATLLTLGAGGSGGVFAPSLFLGGMVGGAFGNLLYAISPQLAPHPSIYAIAGMAALFAASAQAPFVAITILLEITGDYHLTAEVMACAVISFLTYTFFTRDSMYTVKLRRRGIKIYRGDDIRPMAVLSVQTAMEPLGDSSLHPSALVAEAWQKMTRLNRSFLPVVSRASGLEGIVTMRDIVTAMQRQERNTTVQNIIQPLPKPIANNESLDRAIRYLSMYNLAVMPVQDTVSHRIVGVITQSGILKAYNASVVHAVDTSHQVETLGQENDGLFVEMELPASSPAVGQAIQDLALSKNALIVSVTRKQGAMIPHGMFVLESGDHLLVYVVPASDRQQIIDQLKAKEIVAYQGN